MTGRSGDQRRGRAADRLLAIAAALAGYALAVWWTGGFNLRFAGVRLRSHEWERPLAAAAVAAAAALWIDRRRVAVTLERTWPAISRLFVTRALVALAATWVLGAGVAYGTFAIGGSDSYGYVGQAQLFASGKLTDTVPLSPAFTWPDAEVTLRPLAFTQGERAGEIAPIYPPGLPLLMAPLLFLGEPAVYLLVPAFALLTIWATWRLGLAFGVPLAGACAALLLAVSPTFLFQVVQPMSDIPSAACWLTALLLSFRRTARGAAAAGLVASLAILIRPNLAPLAGAIALPLVLPRERTALRTLVVFTAALIPGLGLLGWIQAVRYGSPLASGYGALSDAFALSNIVPNLARYPRWLTETHTPLIWAGLAAPYWLARRGETRVSAWAAALLGVGTWVAYLPYVYFRPDEWFYTRFLLPALPVMLVFETIVLVGAIGALPAWLRTVTLVSVMLGLVIVMSASAARHGAFEMREQEQKYRRAGHFVRDALPPNAFVIAMQHSGSIRYYAGRPTLRFDLLDASKLDEALAILRREGHEPYLVLDVGEDPVFRRKFDEAGQLAVRRLTPIAVLGDARVYTFE